MGRDEKAMKYNDIQILKDEQYIDPVTRCYNRAGFIQALTQLLLRYPDDAFTLVCANIRNFKVINEVHGFDMGDELLEHYAERIVKIHPIIYARMECDRFMYCIPKIEFHTDTLIELSRGQFKDIQYSVRFGIYGITDRELSVSAMCDRAKAAKKYISDEYYIPYCIWDERMRDEIVFEGIFAEELQPSLQKGEFCVYYQPIVDTATKQIVSAESLIRWNHYRLGCISPSKFIPLFEKDGSVTKLDYFVGCTVASMIQARIQNSLPIVPISVNVSRADFHNHQMAKLIAEKMEQLGVPTKYIKVEVTESIYAFEPQQMHKEIKGLHDAGIKILLDDFGSGYSSFNTLHNLDVDIIKIDMKFIENFQNNTKSKVIVAAIIDMAHKLDYQVVCEGVETEEQYEFLKAAGCDFIQGYYFYKPMPQKKFEELLNGSV